jgi:hypothetical protein
VAGIFAGDLIHFLEDADSAKCDVLEITDRRADKVQTAREAPLVFYWIPGRHGEQSSTRLAAVARGCAACGGGLLRALQPRAFERGHRVHHAKRTCSLGISKRFGPSGIGSWNRRGNSGRVAGSGRVTDETDYLRFAGHPRDRAFCWHLRVYRYQSGGKRSAGVSQKEFASNAKSDIATRHQLASHFGRRSAGPVICSKCLLCVESFVEAVRMHG